MSVHLNAHSLGHLLNHPDPASITKLSISPYGLSFAKEATLKEFTNIEELYLFPSPAPQQLPLAIFQWQKLHTLTLQGVHTAELWPHIARLPHLRILNINVINLKSLPYELSNCQQLEELNWLDTRFEDQLEDWFELEELPNLQWMNLLRCSFKRATLEGLADVPLKGLLLPKRHASYFYKKNKDYCDNLWYTYQHTAAEAKSYKTIVHHTQKEHLDWQQRALLLQLLVGNLEKIADLATPQRILAISDLPLLEPLRLKALEYYSQQWPPTSALHPEACLTVLGKIATSKSTLRQQLKDIGPTYSPKLSLKTTHVLLGQQSKGAYQEAVAQGLPLLTEIQVLDYITTQGAFYLVQEEMSTPEQVDNIQQLLISGQEDNIALAVAFFEQGGFPKRLLTPLFYAYHIVEEGALRKAIQRLLRQYGSPAVVAEMQALVHFYTEPIEARLKKHLTKLHTTSELDVLQLANWIYTLTGHGFTFLLQIYSLEEGVDFLREMMVDNILHLDRMGLTTIPAAVYELEALEELNVYNNNLKTIPIAQLKRLPKLKCINAPQNYDLIHNEKWRRQLQKELPHISFDY